LELPATIKQIKKYAFVGCEELASTVVPEVVKKIEQ